MRRVAVAWVLCLLAAGAVAQAPSQNANRAQAFDNPPADQQPRQEAKPEKPAERPKTVSPPPASFIPRNDDIGASEHAPKAEGEQKDWWKSFFSDVKITDVAIALFTLALVIYTARLNKSTHLLWEAAKEQGADTKDAAVAAKESAGAANRSAKVAETALIGIDRPYVFLARPVIYLFARELCRYPHAEYYVKNFGRTPAIIRKRVYGLKFVENIPDAPPYQEATHIDDYTVIEAGGELLGEAAQANRILDDSEVELTRNNVLKSLFFGRIEYEDTFGTKYEMGFGYVRQPSDNRHASNDILGACEHTGYNYHRKIET